MRSFPVHDLPAVLAAAAALLLVSACGQQPGDEGSGAGPSASSMTAADVPAALFHAALGCPASIGALVLQRVPIMLSHQATVVVARCDSGAGSPPSGVFVVSGAGARADITATLVLPSAQVEISDLTVSSGHLTAVGMGYSTPDVPRCCPDRPVRLVWRIDGSHLVASG